MSLFTNNGGLSLIQIAGLFCALLVGKVPAQAGPVARFMFSFFGLFLAALMLFTSPAGVTPPLDVCISLCVAAALCAAALTAWVARQSRVRRLPAERKPEISSSARPTRREEAHGADSR